jgi:chemotaxis protein MotB
MITTRTRTLLLSGLALAATGWTLPGCCTDVENRLNRSLDQLGKARTELRATQGRETSLQASVLEAQKEVARLRALSEAQASRLAALGQQVGESEKLSQEQRERMLRELEETRKEIERLRAAKAKAEERTARLRELLGRFQALIKSGKVKVAIRDGRMVVVLESAVLFDSGKTLLKPEGKKALAEITQVLRTMTDRQYQVAGHTDDTPVRLGPYRSNWELSTARAVEVVKLMQSLGMPTRQLSAAGYGEHSPVKPNTTPENKAENRRIEIVLQPKLDELPSLEGVFDKT